MNLTKLFIFITFLTLTIGNVNIWAERYINLSGNGPTYYASWVAKGSNDIAYWPVNSFSWYLNTEAPDGFTFSQVQSIIATSYGTWQAVSTSDITFSYSGSTSDTYGYDSKNVQCWVYSGDDLFDSVFDPDGTNEPTPKL